MSVVTTIIYVDLTLLFSKSFDITRKPSKQYFFCNVSNAECTCLTENSRRLIKPEEKVHAQVCLHEVFDFLA